VQHVDRGRRPGGSDRPRRDHLRVSGRPVQCADRGQVGRSRGLLADSSIRRRCELRCRGAPRREQALAVRDLGNEPRPGRAIERQGAEPGGLHRPRGPGVSGEGVGLHGPRAGNPVARGQRGHGLRGLLHQWSDRGSAHRRGSVARQEGRCLGTDVGRAGLDAGQGRRRSGGSGPDLPRRRGAMAQRWVFDVSGHEPGSVGPG